MIQNARACKSTPAPQWSTGYADLDATLRELTREWDDLAARAVAFQSMPTPEEMNEIIDAQMACYDEAERRNRWRAVLIFLGLLALAVVLSWAIAKILGSGSPAPRTAMIFDACVVVPAPSARLGLARPSHTGLQDGLQRAIVRDAHSAFDIATRCVGQATHAAGLAPEKRVGPSGAGPSMGPPWLADFLAHTTSTPRSSPQEAA